MQTAFKKSFIWIVVVAIAILLGVQLVFSYRNSRIIDENLKTRHQAQTAKLTTLDIIRSLHLLDLGIRGFALVPSAQIGSAYDSAQNRLKIILPRLEQYLQAQRFNMADFYEMKDSVNAYLGIARIMFGALHEGRRDEFLTLLRADYGYNTWIQYVRFSSQVNQFENNIIAKANLNYQTALKRNYTALTLLILLVVPTLLYMAYTTFSAYDVSEKLRMSEAEKNKILRNQNETLEKLVKERTDEIARQNEQIQANLDYISNRNQQLEEAKRVIEQKNQIIQVRNEGLGLEVEKQTKSLRESNQELVRNINQLEQFSYSVSHNLRAPVARLTGLIGILKLAKSREETDDIQRKISNASLELDQVLKDLVQTVEIKKEINNAITKVSLTALTNKTLDLFQDEISDNQISVRLALDAPEINSVSAYLESILFNLVSNAIKYRSKHRTLVLEISTLYQHDWFILKVKDNGIGLDVESNKRELFSFYKRFHFHVEGRGMGLYLVKSQVELLGGSIDIESEVNSGSTFTVKLKHNLNHTKSPTT